MHKNTFSHGTTGNRKHNKKTEEIQQPNVVLTPGKMRVIKRNGKVVSFEEEKLRSR